MQKTVRAAALLLLTRLGTLTVLAFFLTTSSIHAQTEPQFSTDDAYLSAVRFEAQTTYPGGIHGYDAAERLVWSSFTSGTFGRRYAEDGRLSEVVDDLGNREVYIYDAQGLWLERQHQTKTLGTWVERFAYDTDRAVVYRAVDDGTDLSAFRLEQLGVPPGTTPLGVTLDEVTVPDGRIVTTSNDFAMVSVWSLTDGVEPQVDQVYHEETTSVGGVSMSILARSTSKGTLLEDDSGGWQLWEYDTEGLFAGVSDAYGPVLKVTYEKPLPEDESAEASMAEIQLGPQVVLRYTWSELEQWTHKQLIFLPTGEIVWETDNKYLVGRPIPTYDDLTDQPRKVGQAVLPGHGPVAEWDPLLWPEGSAVVSVGSQPYALVPFSGGKILHSVTVGEERIDFTEDVLLVHLSSGGQGWGDAPHRAVIKIPRASWSTATSTPTNTASEGVIVEFCPDVGPDCICVTYDGPDGTHIDITCDVGGPGDIPDSGGSNCDPADSGCTGDPGGSNGGGGGTSPPPPPPRNLPGTPPSPAQWLKFQLARTRATFAVEANPSCRALFSRPEVRPNTGWEWASNNIHWRNGEGYRIRGQRKARCDIPSVAAWTTINYTTVFLCDAFTDLSRDQAATIVIHELLHTVGFPEAPFGPRRPGDDRMTTDEISQMVVDKCFTELP